MITEEEKFCTRSLIIATSSNMEWTPKDTWQEKDVYDPSNMPTGNCWKVLEGALSQPIPYKIHHYSASMEAIMNRTSYPKKH